MGWFYDLWKEGNIVGTKTDQYFLSVAYKWLGERKIQSFSLPDFKGYKPGSEDDKELVKALWELFDEADILIAHNAVKFDVKKTNARFAYHRLPPPSPYKIIDTLKEAKKYFNEVSYKLDYLADHWGYGRKLAHTGFHLWRGCMTGDPKAWKHMVQYNKHDVVLLERIYLRIRPWMSTHPDLAALVDRPEGCPNCSSTNLKRDGFKRIRAGKYQQYKCLDCGAWSRSTKLIKHVST